MSRQPKVLSCASDLLTLELELVFFTINFDVI